MSTNIHNQSSSGKFGGMVFTRQRPNETAKRHKGLLEAFRAWRKRRAAEAELARLSDRALADIAPCKWMAKVCKMSPPLLAVSAMETQP